MVLWLRTYSRTTPICYRFGPRGVEKGFGMTVFLRFCVCGGCSLHTVVILNYGALNQAASKMEGPVYFS